MKWKQIFSAGTLSLCLSLGLTACNFNFTSKETISNAIITELNNAVNNQENIDDLQEILDAFQDVDNTNNEKIGEIAQDIKDWAEQVVAENEILDSFQEATLVRVVDGDTLVVKIEQDEFKVRLIGINTPESVAPPSYRTENSEEGANASFIVKNYLKDVQKVYLQKDVSDTDKYGRLLRYVWLDIPKDKLDKTEIQAKMLNAMLVDSIQFDWGEPVAEPTTYAPDTMYANVFNELYNEAIDFVPER